jgi:hypothetical protein
MYYAKSALVSGVSIHKVTEMSNAMNIRNVGF